MTEKLFLDSLEIRNFRAFEHLRIEKLGRVNLIVGKNNVGKTCLLESLWLYSNQGHPSAIWRILENRDEGRRPRNNERRDLQEWGMVKYLFHGRKKVSRNLSPIEIGPIEFPTASLKISLDWDEQLKLIPLDDEQDVIGFNVQLGSQSVPYKFDKFGFRISDVDIHGCVYVSANGLNAKEIGILFDKVSLTRLETEVVNSLRIIAPEIERISLVSGTQLREGERIPKVKIGGEEEPVPLRSLGEGMNRLFGLSLALVNAKETKILLIDEIESGLHYSVQPDVWRLVFEVARRLNIQVFATTHSWDCLTAFQEAAKADQEAEGVLIRLLERRGKIVHVQFDEDELEIVAREGIEVR